MSGVAGQTGWGLEEIGIPGKDFLREALANCVDPLKAIEEFQAENEILLPSLRPMLPLLDLHGTRRHDFHVTVMEELRDKLIQKIREIGTLEPTERDAKLKELLQKSFPVIKIPPLRPVVLEILKNMSSIGEKYLNVIVNDQALYDACDTEVKQQIWKDNQTLFGDQVGPIFTTYIRFKEQLLFDCKNTSNSFFNFTPKARRQGDLVQKLAHMIGRNLKLYDMTLQFLRTLFLRTKNVHYCSLRAELLMSLHDLEIQEVISVDPCHKFTWCLDACIREKNLDLKRSRELQGFLDTVKQPQEKVLGDLSMILCDPYAINFLATSAMKILGTVMNNEILPRENPILVLLLRMLSLGLSAWEMINSQNFKEPKLDPQIVTKFIPSLMVLMVDDQMRTLNTKLPHDERTQAISVIEHSGPPPDAFQAYLGESAVAATLAMYYALNLVRGKEKSGVMRVLGYLATTYRFRAYDDPFLHTLITGLIGMVDDFSSEDFSTVVFDEYLCVGVPQENVTRHLIRLVFNVHHKLNGHRLESILKTLEPTSAQSEVLQLAYKALEEKLKAYRRTIELEVEEEPNITGVPISFMDDVVLGPNLSEHGGVTSRQVS